MKEIVHCARVQFKDTPVFHYGRGSLSGDWYIQVDAPGATIEESDQVVALAEQDGENIIRHPKPPHPRMVRLKWWTEGGREASQITIHLIKLMEAYPPVSVN